jgi:DUF1680 family protein
MFLRKACGCTSMAAKVEEARNQAAVMRGPIVYCLEGVDPHRDGCTSSVDLSEVYIPGSIQWTPRYDASLFGGLTVLQDVARRIPAPKDGSPYYTLGDPSIEPLPVSLMPYYAWANWGISKMSVWLPLC